MSISFNKKHKVYFIIIDNVIVGDFTLGKMGDKKCLNQLDIYKNYRKKGYGTQTMLWLKSNFPNLVWFSHVSNKPAYKLYIKFGKVVEKKLNMYKWELV